VPEPAPRVDQRAAADVARDAETLIKKYAPEVLDPAARAKGVAAALIGVFARFAELIIERLNQAPEKNQLAYLDLLGNSLLPPQPARAPLTFSLAAGSVTDGVVPPGTQVATLPAEGETEPVVFETERELVVTAARLSAVYARVPEQDKYAFLGALVNAESPKGIDVFGADLSIEHILYIGHDSLLGLPGLRDVTVTFAAANPGQSDLLDVRWESWDGQMWSSPTRVSDTARVKVGEPAPYLVDGGVVLFQDILPIQRQKVANTESRWLRCRSLTAITAASSLPFITAVNLTATASRSEMAIESAFANNAAVDVTKDFLPFGEQPRAGDTLYLAVREAFSERGAAVTLNVTIANSPRADGNPKLKWEFWNGQAWFQLNPSVSPVPTGLEPVGRPIVPPPGANFNDQTQSFTKPGAVSFKFPVQPVATIVNGVEAFWIRVRLESGNYGQPAQYVPVAIPPPADGTARAGGQPKVEYQLIPETFLPPSISSITVNYTLTRTNERAQTVVAYNDFTFEDFEAFAPGQFAPFRPTRESRPALYLGFTLPRELKAFPNRKMSLFCGADETRYLEKPASIPAGEKPRLLWGYMSDRGWSHLQVRDESESLTRPGLIEFIGPADFAPGTDFGFDAYWVRAVWESGRYSLKPRLHRLLLNTIMAAHALSVKDEDLGSSDGSANQTFRTAHAPVLEGQRLEVRETQLPSAAEHLKIRTESGEDLAAVVRQAADRGREVWVRWTPVPDFYGSGSRDRHYVIESLTGEIRFGDGLSGMIPPAGSGNIRIASYRSGGGTEGNKAAGTITQLKTTVPYVEKVTNYEAASGGADAEAKDALIERGPRTIRHRGRAVTIDDYEDLAKLASTAVARAKCVPLYDLEADPGATTLEAGTVSLIIVPRSSEAKPLASVGLIDRVRDYVGARKVPSARLSVVGPQYVQVDVVVEAAVTSLDGASEVELGIASTLARFLHPLSGGLDGKGWDFGRRPHKSDLYALLEAVPGVDHIRSLDATLIDDRSGKRIAGDAIDAGLGSLFLVYSGNHEITLAFEEP
jgi:baseplate J-like protein